MTRAETRRPHVRRVFWVALAASLGVHVLWSLLPGIVTPGAVTEPALTATLETMPPPPPSVAHGVASSTPHAVPTPRAVPAPRAATAFAAPPSPVARRKAVRTAAPILAAAPRDAAADSATTAATEDDSRISDGSRTSDGYEASAGSGVSGGSGASSAEVQDTHAASGAGGDAAMPKLPPRVDLAYQVFLGTRGFMIGDATYRFERDGDHYRISTVGQARGLAALFIHGTGKVESRGVITRNGLKPSEFVIERGGPDKRETARFDWTDETVSLNDGRTESLEAPAFDPLSVLWQPYFSPLGAATELTFTLATTRKVARYTLTREGSERVVWHHGSIDTERWHRVSDDGKTEAWFWLAPSLHFIPVQMRATRTSRGTLEAKLASIRVDAQYAGFEADPAGPVPPPPPAEQRTNPFRDLTP